MKAPATFTARARAAWRVLTQSPPPPRAARNTFLGAENSRLTFSWATVPLHINRALYQDLRVLRARSRDLARSNEYATKFLSLVVNNVVGHCGAKLQVKALKPDGKIDEMDSAACEKMFAEWAKIGNCEITGKLSFVDVQQLYIRTMARDGEALVRRHATGPFGYQLELVDPQLLDERLNLDLPNGNKVRMGVEFDRMHRPVAYYFVRTDTSDPMNFGFISGSDHERVSADQVWHRFVMEEASQLRGKPWMAPVIWRAQMMGGYEEAAMVASRLGAAEQGFFETPDGDAGPLANSTEGAVDEGSEQLVLESEPGVYRGLPPGYKFVKNDPRYPHEMYADFIKQCLRGFASGTLTAYNDLANDLENVNYSSIRAGTLDVRETWKTLQGLQDCTLLGPVYSELLPRAILSGKLALPFSKLAKFDAASWQGRRWEWVDPKNDTEANKIAVQNGFKSYSQIIREQGRDPDDVWRELESDRQRLGAMGLKLDAPDQKPAATGEENAAKVTA